MSSSAASRGGREASAANPPLRPRSLRRQPPAAASTPRPPSRCGGQDPATVIQARLQPLTDASYPGGRGPSSDRAASRVTTRACCCSFCNPAAGRDPGPARCTRTTRRPRRPPPRGASGRAYRPRRTAPLWQGVGGRAVSSNSEPSTTITPVRLLQFLSSSLMCPNCLLKCLLG